MKKTIASALAVLLICLAGCSGEKTAAGTEPTGKTAPETTATEPVTELTETATEATMPSEGAACENQVGDNTIDNFAHDADDHTQRMRHHSREYSAFPQYLHCCLRYCHACRYGRQVCDRKARARSGYG